MPPARQHSVVVAAKGVFEGLYIVGSSILRLLVSLARSAAGGSKVAGLYLLAAVGLFVISVASIIGVVQSGIAGGFYNRLIQGVFNLVSSISPSADVSPSHGGGDGRD